jgi:hypothetical protein
LGVKVGVNLAYSSTNENAMRSSNFTGYQAGPIVEFKLPVVGMDFDIAALYNQQGLKFKFHDIDFEERQSTLDVPVNLKFKFGLYESVWGYLTAGPYVCFKLKGYSFSSIPENIRNEFKNESFGAGINLGGGIELFEHLQIGINYRIGLTDDYKSLNSSTADDLKGKTKIWSITATYFF